MKQQISELMDGELADAEAQLVLTHLDKNTEAADDWHVYHLIGDVLRQPELVGSGVKQARLQQRLAQEPVLLTRGARSNNMNTGRTWAVSIAATASALGVVAWMALQLTSTGSMPHSTNLAAGKQQMAPDSSDYMMAHQQFSYGPDMNGGAYSVRTVSYAANAK